MNIQGIYRKDYTCTCDNVTNIGRKILILCVSSIFIFKLRIHNTLIFCICRLFIKYFSCFRSTILGKEYQQITGRNLCEVSTKFFLYSILKIIILNSLICFLSCHCTRRNVFLGVGKKNNQIVGRLTLIHNILWQLSIIIKKLSLRDALCESHITIVNTSSTKVCFQFSKCCSTGSYLTSLLSLCICDQNFSFHSFVLLIE